MNFVKSLPSIFLVVLVFTTSTLKINLADEPIFLGTSISTENETSLSKSNHHFIQIATGQHQIVLFGEDGQKQAKELNTLLFTCVSGIKEAVFSLKQWICSVSFVLNSNLQQQLYPSHFFW